MQSNPFENLNFDQHPRRPSPRLIFLIALAIAYFIVWRIIPHSTLFWLGLPVIVCLAWAASYGWREALEVLHRLIHRLEML